MPILFQTKKFQVEPFADAGGVSFIIRRRSNSKVVAKIPFENKRQARMDVRNRIRELNASDELTQARIRKAQKAIRTGVGLGKEAIREINKLTGGTKKRRKKKRKTKKRRKN